MEIISEKNKSGDSSLHDWFNKSKSSDGKKGWVQLGGKYAGKPCAKQPGQKTKPKCGSSKMKRNLNKKEEAAAFRRKNKKDPNPNRKGKAINVKTEETIDQLFRATLEEKKAQKCWPGYEKKGTKKMFGKTYNNCVKKEEVELVKEDEKKGKKVKRKVKFWWDDDGDGKGYEKHEVKEGKQKKNCGCGKDPCDTYGIKEEHTKQENKKIKKISKELKGAVEMHGKQAKELEKIASIDEGKKDACYHKVKSRYSVWPSAYASGALVKCRKVGAANWGNKSKKESYSWRDELDFVQEGAAWTKKEGKNKSGGLNEKGRKSYERENPGSDLKAPSKKKGNKRRKSFCARMKGMKKKLTSAKTARDPDSRINKSLRAWNC
tara:strand:- start:351 stop:1478 length:1128 start_codon:yes stop_codon:yes gene_type:complete